MLEKEAWAVGAAAAAASWQSSTRITDCRCHLAEQHLHPTLHPASLLPALHLTSPPTYVCLRAGGGGVCEQSCLPGRTALRSHH